MTHDILPCDVDLATKLRSAGYSDDAVITALVHRGIDSADATQLLDDLRNGRQIKTKLQKGLESTPRRRSRERRSEHPREGEGESRESHRENHRSVSSESELHHRESHERREPDKPRERRESSHKRHEPRSEKKRFRFWPWMIALSASLGAVFCAVIFFNHGNRFSTTAAARERTDASASGHPMNLAPAELAVEFRPAGLHLAGTLVTRDNALKVAAEVLGSPTRTTPGKEDTINYAFDDYGVVICGRKDGANDSILLDCDAIGGAVGTTTRFKGLLRVDDDAFRAETPSQKLVAFKKLGLHNTASDGGILDGRYRDLGLVFVYLKTPARLSVIEIDFK